MHSNICLSCGRLVAREFVKLSVYIMCTDWRSILKTGSGVGVQSVHCSGNTALPYLDTESCPAVAQVPLLYGCKASGAESPESSAGSHCLWNPSLRLLVCKYMNSKMGKQNGKL